MSFKCCECEHDMPQMDRGAICNSCLDKLYIQLKDAREALEKLSKYATRLEFSIPRDDQIWKQRYGADTQSART